MELFSLCYSALYSDHIKNLIVIATPVDFSTSDNIISHLLKKLDIDKIIDNLGNFPGIILKHFFQSLKPLQQVNKYQALQNNLEDASFVQHFLKVEKWVHDVPDHPGQVLRDFVKNFYQQNKLVQNRIYLNKRHVNLKKLNMPILNIVAKNDYLVPPSASLELREYISSDDYTTKILPGGHIGIYISRKNQHLLPTVVADWLRERK